MDGPYAEVDYPGGGSSRLFVGDAVELLEEVVPAGTADCLITSPPYNRGVRYGRYRDRLPREAYLAWVGTVGRAAARALAPDGSFFLNVGSPPTDPFLAFDVARAVGGHLVLQNVIHWVKSIAIDRGDAGRASGLPADLAVGHYKPVPSSRYLHGAHEYIFQFTHSGAVRLDRLAVGVPYADRSNVGRWASAAGGRRCRGNTWFLPYETIRFRERDRPHPASFPVALPERCLRLHGLDRVRLVVDPFLGIGSTAVAAARLGRPFLGGDLDPEYVEVARRRVVEALGADRPVPAAPEAKGRPRRRE